MKAVLINMGQEHKQTIDELMTVFCSAIRYSFNRIMESMKILDIEKDVARKYSLNSRQGKDAVENARQTIESQKQLVQMEYDNYTKKVVAIENQLQKPNICEKKRNALLKKIDKRKRKQEYYKNFIDTSTIPPVIFGSKNLFIKRCKGLITKEEWQSARSNRIYSRGDKTKDGNPNLRVVLINNMTYLEILTLEKTKNNRAIKIRVPIYLSQKRSKKTGIVNGIDYRSLFLEHIDTREAYQEEIIKNDDKYYCHQYGMEVHNGAAMVIGRRCYEFKENIPKILKDKLIPDIYKFNKKNEWARWSEINRIIKRKVGEKDQL